MEHAELFLLLPVYEESIGQSAYVKRIGILEEEKYEELMTKLRDVSSYFCYENYECYYDSRNLNAFMIPIVSLGDCYPKVSTLLRRRINNWGSDWRRNKSITEQDKCKFLGSEIVDDTLCEMVNRKQKIPECTYLLVDDEAIVQQTDKCELLFKGKIVEIDNCKFDVKPLARWFGRNRRPIRKFHLNPKHGEKGKGAHPANKGDKVSLLLCSEEEAAIMLNKAVGESADSKTLYFWDSSKEKYIEFKCEVNQVYHGFHLDEEDAKQRISVCVKEKIKKLL